MSSSLKTLVLRWPNPTAAGHASNLVRCCPKAPLSTARPACLAQSPLRQQRQGGMTMPQVLSRANHSLANSAPRSGSAAQFKPASTLASKPHATPASSMATANRSFATATSQANSGAQGSPASSGVLDWDSFFKLRLRRRRIQLFFSVTSGLVSGAAGAMVLSAGLAEPLVAQIPLDPFATLGLMTLACTAMGWLVGPSIGSQVFYLANRRLKTQMMQKEAQFFSRVKKNRVDPSNSSAGNPVPDFYGEKIQSVAGYRQWLKDQRAFNKKKTRAFL